MRMIPPRCSWLVLCLITSPAAAAVDQTGEGLSDVWEAAYGTGLAPLLDDDGDGFSNREESIAGTNPLDPADFPRGSSFDRSGEGVVSTRFFARAGVSFQAETSTNLIDWLPVGQPVLGTGGMHEISFRLSDSFVAGAMPRSVWTGLTGYGVSTIRSLAATGAPPALEDFVAAIDFPQSNPDADQFGMFIRGWLIPPADGFYTFWIASDDGSELRLSTNSSPDSLALTASVPGYTAYRQWDKYPEQQSAPVLLETNRSYYFEVYQRESWGGDHLSVAWTRPDRDPAGREIIALPHFSSTGQRLAELETNGMLTFRLRLSQPDSDGDGVSDYEEHLLGLDPGRAETRARQPDLEAARGILDSDNTVTIGATAPRAYEADTAPGRVTIYRAGSIEPLTIAYTASGSAAPGADYQPLAGVIHLPAGRRDAAIDIIPIQDGLLETQELVTITLQPGTNFTLGTPASATVAIDDARDILYVALLRPPESVTSSGYGYAVIRRAGNGLNADVRLSFSGLSGTNAASVLLVSSNGLSGTPVLRLPDGQVPELPWHFESTNGLDSVQILQQLDSGGVWLRLDSSAYPGGELTGRLLVSPAWDVMPPPPAAAPASSAPADRGEASRFLTQATFGPSLNDLAAMTSATYAAWIDQQLALPPTYHLPFVEFRRAELMARDGNDGWQRTRQEAWWQHALTAPDQLRQRMAFALSQILVVSQFGALDSEHVGTTIYYDTLLEHAFGNFRDLLEDVTLSPMMGTYLSMMRNRKPDPLTGHEPDENYAREIMQLFSIGLMRMHSDGSLMLDGDGMPIPTYTQDDIVALAHVFTGWSVHYNPTNPPTWSNGSTAQPDDWFLWGWDSLNPMSFYGTYHDTNDRVIVNGTLVPGGTNGPARLNAALDALFHHPNTGPFIARQLIQRFVTSNPGPGYIHRVASVFNDNGSGVRGDLGAVIRAVLLDPDARNPEARQSVTYGKPIEPVLRMSRMLRASLPDAPFATNGDHRLFIHFLYSLPEQAPLMSPSVFNFFQPVYSQPGRINAEGLLAPEFQIFAETAAIREANLHYSVLNWGIGTPEPVSTNENARLTVNIDPLVDILNTPGLDPVDAQAQLIDTLDELLLFGAMSPELRADLMNAFASLPSWYGYELDRQQRRVLMALYLIYNNPEFLVQR